MDKDGLAGLIKFPGGEIDNSKVELLLGIGVAILLAGGAIFLAKSKANIEIDKLDINIGGGATNPTKKR